MQSRVWAEYATSALHARLPDPQRKEIMKGGGRGYYRNVSLLSAWAHAPFMHNNAVGPEICGKPADAASDFYSSPYADSSWKPLGNPPPCRPYDPSVEGRYRLYVDSMRDMLNPAKRLKKVHLLDRDVIIDIVPKVELAGLGAGLSLTIPKGYSASAINSLRLMDIIQDAVLLKRDAIRGRKDLDDKYASRLSADQIAEMRAGLAEFLLKLAVPGGSGALDLLAQPEGVMQRYYSNVLDWDESDGHRFGEALTDREKDALIAFVATL